MRYIRKYILFRVTCFENSTVDKSLIAKLNFDYFYNFFNFLFSSFTQNHRIIYALFIYKMFNSYSYKNHYTREVESLRQIDLPKNAEPRAEALNTQNTLYRLRPYSRRGFSCTRPCLARSFSCATFAIRAPCPVASLPCARSSYSSFHLRAAERYI